MDTSQDYYRSVMLQFKTYGRGRSLEQFCRDEAVDYNWLCKAKDLYGALKCMKPVFSKIAETHTITRSQLLLLVTGAVKSTIKIN